jgi:hypothetical protein
MVMKTQAYSLWIAHHLAAAGKTTLGESGKRGRTADGVVLALRLRTLLRSDESAQLVTQMSASLL